MTSKCWLSKAPCLGFAAFHQNAGDSRSFFKLPSLYTLFSRGSGESNPAKARLSDLCPQGALTPRQNTSTPEHKQVHSFLGLKEFTFSSLLQEESLQGASISTKPFLLHVARALLRLLIRFPKVSLRLTPDPTWSRLVMFPLSRVGAFSSPYG